MAKTEKARRIVFCDFDGTITAEETFVKLLQRFAPLLYPVKARRMKNGEITLKQAVRSLLESIPAARYPEMLAYIRGQKLRPGFEAFLDLMRSCNVPVVVISGGLRGLVTARLGALTDKIEGIYAADVRTDSQFLTVHSDFEGRDELVSKVDVMRRYDYEQAIVVGNGITDVKMSGGASLIFARGFLAEHLRRHRVAFQPWRDFFDIAGFLAQHWKAICRLPSSGCS